jgi:hypothetical protein
MPASSTLIGGTRAHQHSTSAADGGSLADGITTMSLNQGEILYSDGATLNALATGTNNFKLTTHGAGADPTWTADASANTNLQTATLSSNFTTSSTVYTSVGLAITPSQSSGMLIMSIVGNISTTNAGDLPKWYLGVSGSGTFYTAGSVFTAGNWLTVGNTGIRSGTASAIDLFTNTQNSGYTVSWIGTTHTADQDTKLFLLEIY